MTINLSALQKQRRDTAANWTAEDPTLLAGEIGLESDTGYWKVGDGATAWTSLAYVSGLGAEISVDRLADGAARQLLQTDAAGTGVEWTDNVDVPGTLDVTGTGTFDGNVTIAGDLTVNGTTTTINTQDLLVEDKNIIIGNVTTPSDVTADGGGITLKGTTDKTINWVDSTDAWTLSEHVDLGSGKEYRINGTKVLDATSLGSGVVSSSLTSVGTIGTGVWQGTAIDAAYLDSTVVTTGDTGTVTSTMIADGTIVDADVNASAAIAGTKISPDFGAQNVTTTGTSTAASFIPTSSTVPTNGVYLPAANSVALSTNSTKRIEIQADGDIDIDSGGVFYDATNNRLAIGTTSPGATLHVQSSGDEIFRINTTNAGGPYCAFQTNGTNFLYLGSAAQLASGGATDSCIRSQNNLILTSGGATEKARIDSSGRLLVGTSSAVTGSNTQYGKLQVLGNTAGSTSDGRLVIGRGEAVTSSDIGIGQVCFTDNTAGEFARIVCHSDAASGNNDYPGRLMFSTTADGASSPTEAMRINNAGELLVGYTADNGAYKLQVNSQIFATSATIATSDGRYKENVATLDGCVDLVKALRPVSFDWKEQQDITRVDDDGNEVLIREGHNFPDGTQVGFIAQEVQEVLADKPWLGSVIKQNVRHAVTDNDGNELAPEEEFLGIAEGNLIAVLTSALQEAIGRVEQLEAAVTALQQS